MHLFDWAHRIDLHSEIQEIYLHRFLFKLALGTVTIFLPLYLHELGFAVQSIFLFFAVYYGAFIVLSWPAAHLTARIGYKHTSFLSSPFILGFYILLRSLESASPFVFLTAVVGGIGFILYWIGMNSEMARSSHDGHREKETGYFFSMPLLASIISPFFGGLIITAFSFDVLFLLTAAAIAVSYVPFLFTDEHYSGLEVDARNIFDGRHAVDFLTFASRGATGLVLKILWPLYLAVEIMGALDIGGAGSLMALGGAMANIALGQYLDHDNRGTVLGTGAVLLAGVWLIMPFVTTSTAAFAMSFGANIIYILVILPLYTEALDHAEQEDIIEYFAFREVALCTGRIVLLVLFAVLFIMFSPATAFLASFGAAASASILVGVFGNMLMNREQ